MRIGALAVLVLVNLGLAAGLAYLWHDPERRQWDEPAPVLPSLNNDLAVPGPQLVEISRYRETIERPLFAATRRPAAPTTQDDEADKSAADPLQSFRLLGVYVSGDRGGAIIDHGGQVRRVPFGETIGGWTVTGREAGGVSLARGKTEKRELQIALFVGPARSAVPSDARTPSAPAGDARSPVADQVTQRRQEILELRRRRIEERRAAGSSAGGETRGPARGTTPAATPGATPSAPLGPIERLR